MSQTVAVSSSLGSESSRITFAWLLKLRWGAVVCQLLLIGVVSLFFAIELPNGIILSFISFQAASNLFFQFLLHRRAGVPPLIFGLIMVWDIIHLTLLLYFTGGAMNPFTFLYLVHVALGALIMSQIWAWGLASLTVAGYALLFLLPPPPVQGSGLVAGQSMPGCNLYGNLHLQGMWVAYSLTALFIVFFLGRIQKALAGHQQTLLKLEEARTRGEKMTSLATLAAGAAHELSTPLSTIAVAAAEMEDQLRSPEVDAELLADARLIRSEVRKCGEILRQLSTDAGEQPGESFREISLSGLLAQLCKDFAAETGQRIALEPVIEDFALFVPVQAWLRTLKGLLKNGWDADPTGVVSCRAVRLGDLLSIIVSDRGQGFSPEVLARAGEPFFTTKGPTRGMGLGLFLARTLAERYGGELRIQSEKGRGTSITFSVALAKVSGRRSAGN
ncbi:MAG: HAMP domain-containing histidine kinase [Desulfobulbaceae bacterium]|nr:HAMP domain-containing histidine kinase [Desulfobulbaceae bacterium]